MSFRRVGVQADAVVDRPKLRTRACDPSQPVRQAIGRLAQPPQEPCRENYARARDGGGNVGSDPSRFDGDGLRIVADQLRSFPDRGL